MRRPASGHGPYTLRHYRRNSGARQGSVRQTTRGDKGQGDVGHEAAVRRALAC